MVEVSKSHGKSNSAIAKYMRGGSETKPLGAAAALACTYHQHISPHISPAFFNLISHPITRIASNEHVQKAVTHMSDDTKFFIEFGIAWGVSELMCNYLGNKLTFKTNRPSLRKKNGKFKGYFRSEIIDGVGNMGWSFLRGSFVRVYRQLNYPMRFITYAGRVAACYLAINYIVGQSMDFTNMHILHMQPHIVTQVAHTPTVHSIHNHIRNVHKLVRHTPVETTETYEQVAQKRIISAGITLGVGALVVTKKLINRAKKHLGSKPEDKETEEKAESK